MVTTTPNRCEKQQEAQLPSLFELTRRNVPMTLNMILAPAPRPKPVLERLAEYVERNRESMLAQGWTFCTMICCPTDLRSIVMMSKSGNIEFIGGLDRIQMVKRIAKHNHGPDTDEWEAMTYDLRGRM